MERESSRRDDLRQCRLALCVDDDHLVACSLLDLDGHLIKVIEFQDSKFLVALEALMLQLLPVSSADVSLLTLVVFPKSLACRAKLEALLDLLEMSWEEASRDELSKTAQNRDILESLLKQKLAHFIKKTSGLEKAVDLVLLTAQRFRLTEDRSNLGIFDMQPLDLKDFLRLDSNAVQALNLVSKTEPLTVADKEKDFSLLGLMDTCKTKMGPRTLRRWLLQPLVNLSRIEDRLDLVEYFVHNDIPFGFFTNSYLANVCDVEKIGTRLFRVKQDKPNQANLSDVCKVYQLVKLSRAALCYLNEIIDSDLRLGRDEQFEKRSRSRRRFSEPTDAASPQQHILEIIQVAFAHMLGRLQGFLALVEDHIDLSKLERGEFLLKPSTSPELAQLANRITDKKIEVDLLVRAVESELGAEVQIEKNDQGHYLMRIQKQHEKRLTQAASSSKDFKIVSIRANHLMATCTELKRLSLTILDLDQDFAGLQALAAKKILLQAASYYPDVEELAEFLGEIDALLAVARFSKQAIGGPKTRPVFNTGERLVLEDARHPLLDRTQPTSTVSNSCVMEKTRSSFHVITGPNMGGKSTFIRQVAINIILAQMGCFCFAKTAELPLFDSLVTRVGAGDAQSKGLSTWMSELLEVSCMLECATDRTFLIIDELGRGTSTSEGVGMTYAIAEHIIDKLDSYCLFATHYFELTSLEQSRPQAKNFHVEAHVVGSKVQMNYKIKPGFTDKSYGVYILSLLAFPRDIIDRAHSLTESAGHQRYSEEDSKASSRASSSKPSTVCLDMDTKVQLIKAFSQARHLHAASKSHTKTDLLLRLKSLMDSSASD